jgi:ribonuclease HII
VLKLIEIRRRYLERGRPLPRPIEEALRADARPGARALLLAVEARRRAHRREGQRLRKMLRFEQALWERGVSLSRESTKRG